MAELTITATVQANDGELNRTLDYAGTAQVTTVGTIGSAPGLVEIPNTETTVTLPLDDVSLVRVVNLGPNPVNWGFTTGQLLGLLPVEVPTLLYLKPTTLSLLMQATTGTSKVMVEAFEA
jgi:hypothetical protein